MVNFYRRVGELILGSRLKRISDKFLSDVSNIYKQLHINFEVSWFPIFYLLNEKGKLSVTELARELEITHSAVSQIITQLDKKGLIKFIEDKNDKRRRFIGFTHAGKKLMSTLPPVWEAMQHSVQKIFSEGVNSTHILSALDELEDSLEKESLTTRVTKEIEKGRLNDIVINDYKDSYNSAFKKSVLNWFIDNNDLAKEDSEIINNPQKFMRELNTSILVAVENNQCVGFIAYRKLMTNEIKIIFLVIPERFKKNLIGTKLLSEMFKRSDSKKIKSIKITISRSNSQLIKLLKDAGFQLHAVDNTKNKTDSLTHLIMQYSFN